MNNHHTPTASPKDAGRALASVTFLPNVRLYPRTVFFIAFRLDIWNTCPGAWAEVARAAREAIFPDQHQFTAAQVEAAHEFQQQLEHVFMASDCNVNATLQWMQEALS